MAPPVVWFEGTGEATEENFRMMRFRDYLLSEAIKPNKTNYGTTKNFNDFGIYKIPFNSGELTFTFFQNIKTYIVAVDDRGEVSFGTVEYDDSKSPIWYLTQIISNRTKINLGNKTFNSVFYILLQLVKKTNHKQISFQGQDNQLDKFYGLLIQNKNFLKEIEKAGYEYTKSLNNIHYFDKK